MREGLYTEDKIKSLVKMHYENDSKNFTETYNLFCTKEMKNLFERYNEAGHILGNLKKILEQEYFDYDFNCQEFKAISENSLMIDLYRWNKYCLQYDINFNDIVDKVIIK